MTPLLRMKFACQWCLVLCGMVLSVGSTGCTAWRESQASKIVKKIDLPDGVPWHNREPRAGVPRRMVATWTDAVRHQPGVDSERGFGGRIYFYDRDESEPIRVAGRLVVYAFDETDRLPTNNQPDKRYVFPLEQFAKHESSSEIGVSYSVWLPWDKVDGVQKDVSLIARFEPAEGGTLIVSDQTRERLPGRLQESEVLLAEPKAARTVQQVAFQQARQAEPTARKRMETTTITRPTAQVNYRPLQP